MRTRDPAASLARFVLLAAVLAAACDSPGVPESRVPAALQMVRGDTQTAAAGQALADSLEVRVLNRGGRPVPGVEVEFSPASGGGTLHPARARTDASGIARAAWTLGPAAGPQTAQGRVRGGRLDALVFTARATPGAPARLVEVSGNHQAGVVGEPLPQPLVVRVVDEHGNGVAGVPVTWECYDEQAVLAGNDTTDAFGHARATLTLGTIAGADVTPAAATFQDQSLEFHVVAVPGPVAEVQVVGDAPRVHPTSARMQATAQDAYGNVVLSETAFTWTSSNPAVAVVEPDPVPSHVTVLTRGGGTVQISASLGELTGRAEFQVRAMPPGFSFVDTGLPWAEALNDRGQLARRVGESDPIHPGPEVFGVWENGAETTFTFPAFAWSGGRGTPAINNQGTVVVHLFQFSKWTAYQGVTWLLRDGILIQARSRGRDINDHEQVVGTSTHGQFYSHVGFVWQGGETTWFNDVPVPTPEYDSYTMAINNRGQVLVNVEPNPWLCRPPSCAQPGAWAFVWEAGRYTPISRPSPACQKWVALDINNLGHVLVRCTLASDEVFVWNGATFTGMALPHASALNDRGEVVSWEADGPYVWRAGEAIRLMDEPRTNRTSMRINNRGQILLNLPIGAYLLTPLP
ncbi:MAG TPA: Ig-like domain-containing protein [Longimicrobium sp.]